MDDRRDELLDRAIAELQELPPMPPGAIDRIVKAAAEARASDVEQPDTARVISFPARRRMIRVSVAIGWAAAAGLSGFIVRDVVSRSPALRSEAPVETRAMQLVSGMDAEFAPVATHFAFEHAGARSVAIVGSFNGWDASAPGARLERQPGSALWSATVPLPPGRHTYAYLINDSLLVLDPRAQSATDPDLGIENSVIIVGKP